MRLHADTERLRDGLSHAAGLCAPWTGHVYRSASPRYANRDDFLTGAGAKIGGARWNPPGSFAATYTSLAPETAALEALAHHRYYGLPEAEALPRVLAAAVVALQRVLNLTDAAARRALRASRRELLAEDWRAANGEGRESRTQAIGRLAWGAEIEALLVPSAAHPGGVNLVIFPGNLTPPGSYLIIVNRESLPRHPAI